MSLASSGRDRPRASRWRAARRALHTPREWSCRAGRLDETAARLLPEQHVLALSWAALARGDRTFQFVVGASSARSASELRAAARDFHSPQQNIVFADTAGEIGFVAAGRVPRRRPDNDLRGLLPGPGWLERYDWAGWIPFEELPARRNPESGAIVTANQKITEPGYPHWLTAEWAEPFRATRIGELLDATERHSIDSFSRIQRDSRSARAGMLLPALLAAMPASGFSEPEAGLLDVQTLSFVPRCGRECAACPKPPATFR